MARYVAQSSKIINVYGLDVTIVRKNVKNVSLRVKDPSCKVVVTTPLYYPESEVRALVQDRYEWIITQRVRIRKSPTAQAANATPQDKAFWKKVVSECVPPLVSAWEPIIGVRAKKLDYRCMTSRWGSCTPSTGRICINTRLALYPPQCLEYVVIHELCHLREANHGPRFHALLDEYMPDWKHWKKVLDGRAQ